MVSLQELLSRSVTQNLGLSDILAKRERESVQAGQSLVSIAGTQAQATLGAAQVRAAGTVAAATAQPGGIIGSVGRGFEAQQKEQAASKELIRKQNIENREIVLKEGEFNLKVLDSLNKTKELTPTEKAILGQQSQGKIRMLDKFSETELTNLPRNAFIDVGFGDDKITVVKEPAKLGAEEKTKLAGILEGRKGIRQVLKQIESGDISKADLLAAATGGFKRAGEKIQLAATKIDFNTEILSRSLSGAAVPETEVVRFRGIFGIKPLDTVETMVFKLKRSADMITRIENMAKFGTSPFESEEFIKKGLDEAASDIEKIQKKNLIKKTNGKQVGGILVSDMSEEEKAALRAVGKL